MHRKINIAFTQRGMYKFAACIWRRWVKSWFSTRKYGRCILFLSHAIIPFSLVDQNVVTD